MSKAHQDEDTLRELYHEKNMSTTDLADRFDVGDSTIGYWMRKHGIERRDRQEAQTRAMREKPAVYTTKQGRWMRWVTSVNNSTKEVLVHRLLAVSEYGFDAVEGMDVHHKNGIPWDNRPDNIELLTPSEHSQKHTDDRLAARWHDA